MGRKHHELRVWQDAVRLVTEVYNVTSTFPQEERFGLTSQMRRSAVSVPSNIAEGAARQTRKEFVNFLIIARGSLAELETQLVITTNLGFLKESPDLSKRVNNLFGKLGALIKAEQSKL